MQDKRYLILTVFITFSILTATIYCATFATAQTNSEVAQQFSTDATEMSTVHYVDVNGVTLGYREYGSGEPLLLICGMGATMNDWNSTFINILASQYHVYAYDYRGMGSSGDDNSTPSISQYADDVVGLIQALDYTSMNIFGTSLGASVSQQIVISHPECVRKMVLGSPTYSIRIPETASLLKIVESIAVDPNRTQGLRNEALADLAWNGSYDGLPSIQKPIMIMVGTNDVLTPASISVQIAGRIEGSWLVRFIDIPHSGDVYAPVQYAESVLNFLGTNELPYTQVAPGAPTNLVAMAGNAHVAISWNAPIDDGNNPIKSYQLYRCTTFNGTYTLLASLNGTLYSDNNLTNGQVYWYKVSAVNSIGAGTKSVSTNAAPQAAGDNNLPYAIIIAIIVVAIALITVIMKRKNRK